MLLVPMHRQEQFKLDIDRASITLHAEVLKLTPVQTRLASVERHLQGQIVADVFRGEKAHASMLANELVIIRKVLKLVADLKIVFETLFVRMGTIKDYSELFDAVNPAVKSLKELQDDLAEVVPAARETFANMSDTFSNTLITLDIKDEPSPSKATDDAIQILEEASRVVEEELKRKFPSLPEIKAKDRVPIET